MSGNFVFSLPTKIVFGCGEIEKCFKKIRKLGKKVLIVHGVRSLKTNGVVDQFVKELQLMQMKVSVFGGIGTNPKRLQINEAAKICREEKIEVVIGIGGGSVMDAAKCIAVIGHPLSVSEDIWNYIPGNNDSLEITNALAVVAVPTLAASGSEANGLAVITDEITREKREIYSGHLFPVLSIVDPLLTLTVPDDIYFAGVIDLFTHIMEPYVTSLSLRDPIDDGIAETLMKAVVSASKNLKKNKGSNSDLEVISWSAVLSLTGLSSTKRKGPFVLHMIEHALSGIYDIHHGTGLAIILPEYLLSLANIRSERLCMLFQNVFGITAENEQSVFTLGFNELKRWMSEIGLGNIVQKYSPKDLCISEIVEMTVKLYGNKYGYVGLPGFDENKITDLLKRVFSGDHSSS